MKTWTLNAVESWPGRRMAAEPPNHLHLVTPQELRELRHSLALGVIPLAFEAKLERLAAGDCVQRLLEQNCRTVIALLLAAQQGDFTQASPDQSERLLRVLAYVEKDEDAIPDTGPHGFEDDWREVRWVTTELAGLLRDFKAWRLRHQVPGLWLARTAGPRPRHAPVR